MMDKLPIGEVMRILRFEDVRSAVKWCRSKSMMVQKFGKEIYVNLSEFEVAMDRPLIESLKARYPQNWKDMYTAYKKGDLVSIAEVMIDAANVNKEAVFVAPGASGSDFIKKVLKKQKVTWNL
jgi:hypothetical protein